MSEEKIIITKSYKRCFELIDEEVETILVSGEAGTGKSVLIHQIEKRYPQRVIIKVAPTGIAALNIGGSTAHSFFRLPIGILTEQTVLNLVGKLMRYGTELFDAMDMLIIEEISMVRADMLDAIDIILRRMRRINSPFGGVQVLFVGDLYQLPPVVVEDEKEQFFSLYDTEYFFSSRVMKNIDFMGTWEVVLLKEVFRQSDDIFVNILNDVRVNRRSKHNTKILNEVCFNDPNIWEDTDDIVLCMTNARAAQRNNAEMRKLDTPEFSYDATITGRFTVKLITPEKLILKVGAKVMFTKNSEYWVNGTMGIVTKLTSGTIEVETIEDGIKYDVARDNWKVTRYRYNNEKNQVVEETVGEFRQFPLMLAWSITTHKSQSLTFDKITIDLGTGAFAAGQVYVALSRCRTLDGIKLLRPIDPWDIKVDPRIAEFYELISEEFEDA